MVRAIAVALAALAVIATPALATDPQPSDERLRAEVRQTFLEMRAHAPWDLNGPATWTFFFTANDRRSLDKAAALLTGMGYAVADERLIMKGAGVMPDQWWLAVSRVQRLTEESLFQQEEDFYAFAAAQGLQSFTGYDVGPPPRPVVAPAPHGA